MRNIAVLFVISFLLTACSGGGGGSAPTNPIPTPNPGGGIIPVEPPGAEKLRPSVSKSTYESNQPVMKEGQETVVTLTIRDQHGSPLNISGKWTMDVRFACDECTNDVTVGSLPSSDPTQKKYKFTPKESKDHSITVLFNPTASYSANCTKFQFDNESDCLANRGRWSTQSPYQLDFPGGIADEELYAVGVVLPRYDVCLLASRDDLHGLKGIENVDGMRMAICSAHDLSLVAADPFFADKDLYIARDIDMSPYYLAGGAEFTIGSYCDDPLGCGFIGSLHGNYKTISNFRTSTSLGLFRYLMEESTVTSLTLKDTAQAGTSGGAVAQIAAHGAAINNVKVTGTVVGTQAVGGLVGELYGGSISYSSFAGTVTSSQYAGGITGISATDWYDSTISRSSATGTVRVQNVASGDIGYAGGLIGFGADFTRINDSYFDGSVFSEHFGAGIAGSFSGTTTNMYVNGSISAEVGGGLFAETAHHASPTVNTVNNSFINITINSDYKAGLAGSCNSLKVVGFSYNSGLPQCLTSTDLETSAMSQHSSSTVSELMASVQTITSHWFSTVWKLTTSALPKII